MKAHCIMHVPYEGTGCIEKYLFNNGILLSFTRIYQKVEFPAMDSIDFLIVMGGPMSVYEEDKFTWLKTEKKFIKDVIDAGKKVLGICLGSQLIAEVLGAKVYPNKVKEIGWFPIRKTQNGKNSRLLKGFEDTTLVFHWHGDTYNLPEDAVHLLQSEYCLYQAFFYQDRVLGLQFHLETTPELIKKMLTEGKRELSSGICIQSANEILEKADLTILTNKFMNNLLDEFLM